MSSEQIGAWDDAIAPLQQEVREILTEDPTASTYSTILEYELPLESRRPDVILLVRGGVVVLELKGKARPSQADLDQAAAYARDLRSYHRECAGVIVTPVLVPTQARGYLGLEGGVHIVGPDYLDALVVDLAHAGDVAVVPSERFLSPDAYRPLPTLVEAARELFETKKLRHIERAHACVEPCLATLSEIVMDAARTKTRRLVLLTGIPGAGKTLVGLQLVHSRYLDDLTVARSTGKPTAPGVFLSGNGPLVQVLQHQLREPGGAGRTFVRGVKDYIKAHSRGLVPDQHVLVFDEAQRAWDAARVAAKQEIDTPLSEPQLFIDFASRIPEWCVVVGLIGTGQEIYTGEEGGLLLWREAVETARAPGEWRVHGPIAPRPTFADMLTPYTVESSLNLDVELRQHSARDLHRFIAGLLEHEPPAALASQAEALERESFTLRLTRDARIAKAYLRERYSGDAQSMFGILASARDKNLDVDVAYNRKLGAWYSSEGSRSCRHLDECVTEFEAQGLELDGAILVWGTDFRLLHGRWDVTLQKRYRAFNIPRDAFKLRMNAYRVLLTRARDGICVYVPPMSELDETYGYLRASGFLELQHQPDDG